MGKSIIIVLSLVFALILSAVGALPSLFWGFSFGNYFATVSILFVAQLFIGRLWNYHVDSKEFVAMEKINSAKALADAVQHVSLSCAYCNTSNLAKIYVGKENIYKCGACNQINSVQLSTSSARVTEPIMPKAEVAEIFKNIDNK